MLNIRNLNNKNNNRIYIFDAKYRINVDDKGKIGPVEDDINVIHRYRDAIVSKLSNEVQFKYDTFGAYVMFPYGDEEKFKKNLFYHIPIARLKEVDNIVPIQTGTKSENL